MHSDASCCLEITLWWWIFAQRLEQPVGLDVFTAAITLHISIWYKSHIDEFATVLLHPGDDKEVKQLFYAILHALMMDQLGPKHAGVDVLWLLWLWRIVCILLYIL